MAGQAATRPRTAVAGPDRAILAKEIAEVTRRETDILTRSPREVRAALEEGRVAVRRDGAGLAGFLFLHRCGSRFEVGTGWVRPDLRRQGLFLDLHHELFARVPAGTVVFGFPGSPGVRRAMERLGFRRASYSALPLRVWMRMVVGRLQWGKLASLARSLGHGTLRTSRELWVMTLPGHPGGRDDEEGQARHGRHGDRTVQSRQG